jgi:hypothetical protein
MTDTLIGYRAVGKQKAVLRILYNDIFERIAGSVVDGTTLELGGGIGNLKEKIASLISSDIQFAPWLDLSSRRTKGAFCSQFIVKHCNARCATPYRVPFAFVQ